MKPSNLPGRGLLAHAGVYAIVIGTLAGINLLTPTADWWFLYPALAWGALLTLHLFWKLPLHRLRPNWRRFLRHLGFYVIVVLALAGIDLIDSSTELWVFYPGLIWGGLVALHFLFGVLLRTDGQQRSRRSASRRVASGGRTRAPRLANKKLRAQLAKAVAYKAQIEAVVKATTHETRRTRLQELTAQVEAWLEDITDLAQRIDYFEQNGLLRRDLETVPRAIQTIEARLARETNQANRADLERMLRNHQKQLAALRQLQALMGRAEIQIESTLSSLGAIYCQILAGQSVDHVADYSHLSAEVEEEVHILQDHLEALQEVKLGRI